MIKALALILASASVLLIFGIWPQLDLASSAMFYDGTGFPAGNSAPNLVLRWILRVAPFVPVLAGLVVLLGGRWWPCPVLGLARRGWAGIVLTFVIGPGLLVNRGLKTYWGRARPRDVTQFGGESHFTPAHQWTDQCAANCSFVSGEVSAVTSLSLALLMLLFANRATMGQGRFRALAALGIALPFLSAYQRISAGAHFLSDAILAALFTLFVGHLVQHILAPKAR